MPVGIQRHCTEVRPSASRNLVEKDALRWFGCWQRRALEEKCFQWGLWCFHADWSVRDRESEGVGAVSCRWTIRC